MTLNIIFSVVDAHKPYPTGAMYNWRGLSLFPLESGGQATYMETHHTNVPTNVCFHTIFFWKFGTHIQQLCRNMNTRNPKVRRGGSK